MTRELAIAAKPRVAMAVMLSLPHRQQFKAPQIKDADTIASDRRRAEVRSPSAG